MRCVMVGLLAFSVVAGFSSVGCSPRSKKTKKESPKITTTSLPEGRVNVSYNFQLAATGGAQPYTWSEVGGNLLAYGLTLNPDGTITGTPTQATPAGGVAVTIEVRDANNRTAQKGFTLVICPELQITTTSLPDGYEGQTGYSATLTASGGNSANYAWSISGNLPSNLTWDPTTATISGDIATGAAGGYQLDFEVTDGVQTATATLTLTVREQLQITTTSLPDATEGVPYSVTIDATGGAPPYTWSVSQQPWWLTIDQSTGQLSGRPPAGSAGTYTFTVEVTDGVQTASEQFDLVVKAAGSGPPKADFEANPTEGTAPLTVSFTDKSTGRITQRQWDFGDGTTSNDQNPTHTYSNPGWYTVRLTVSDGTNSDSCVKEKYILVANNIWYVNGNGGDDGNGGTDWSDAWETIGKALSVAGNYDLVLVADATYSETDLRFYGNKVYVKGVDHNTAGAQPVIDCQGNGRAFYFGSAETEDTVVDNFVIRNGSADHGGAICCANSSGPTLRNCVFDSNSAVGTFGEGGAIYCNLSNPRITDCSFSGNDAAFGGAVYCDNSGGLTLTNCVFSDNSAVQTGGAISLAFSDISITNCIFTGNSSDMGGAMLCCFSSPNVTNCTFSGNDADEGGAVYCNLSSPVFNNCIFWNNSASTAGSEVFADPPSMCILDCCCVDNGAGAYGGGGTVNDANSCIHRDPQFVNAAGGDYHLKDTSPCIDAGDNSLVPGSPNRDPDGNKRIVDGDNDGTATVDIGAYEYQP